MQDYRPSISRIEKLLRQDTEASVTYAALECRLAIERICYERLRLMHDYISHDDLKKWQPRDIVRTLMREVEPNTAKDIEIFIAPLERPEGSPAPTVEELQAIQHASLGKQIGFNPNKLGGLWNALAHVALHVKVPQNKSEIISHYGDKDEVEKKVKETLEEIRRISKSTLLQPLIGETVSVNCTCGSVTKRRLELLTEGQIISCINPDCKESYLFNKSTGTFQRRYFKIVCHKCKLEKDIPAKSLIKMGVEKRTTFICERCNNAIHVGWQPVQIQTTRRRSVGRRTLKCLRHRKTGSQRKKSPPARRNKFLR